MRIGPLNNVNVHEISLFLKERNITYSVTQDQVPSEQTTGKNEKLLYIELSPDDAPAALPLLEKFGIVLPPSPEDAELLESAEYHCLHCDYTANSPGVCSKHQTSLLEYSDWLAADQQAGDFLSKYSKYFFIAVVLAAMAAMYLKSANLL
ncbi:MAG: hypothetical protein IT287_00860 [Bdellovibrionaceae bacterium]|nr:hypothetical protein [Pseudobdellovibrionaceae bacterium]